MHLGAVGRRLPATGNPISASSTRPQTRPSPTGSVAMLLIDGFHIADWCRSSMPSTDTRS